MPITTDSVLVGASAQCYGANSVLDVGTGCGVIALMIAQRNPVARIHAVDIHAAAVTQAQQNFNQSPWSNRLTQSIRSAVSMRVDWDHTIGRLSFVRALMPDTALVFLNMGEGDALARPVEGTLSHAFSADQPWQEYACEADSPVSCAQAGTVTAVGRGAGSDYIVLVSHEGGESVYGYLASAGVQEGQQVEKGQELGKSSERLYFEWREEGQSVDPAERLGG